MDWICFMIDYETFTAADGYAANRDFALCCLLNTVLTDSFAVSEFPDNQSFAIRIRMK